MDNNLMRREEWPKLGFHESDKIEEKKSKS